MSFLTTRAAIGFGRWDEAQIVTESLGTGERTILRTGVSDVRYVPTGHLVYARQTGLFALRFDPETLTTEGGEAAVVSGTRRGRNPRNSTASAQYAFSNSGTLVHIPGGAAGTSVNLVLLDREGQLDEVLEEAGTGSYSFPRFSPDGRRIAFQIDDGALPNVWIYEIGTGTLRQLTNNSGAHPLWSPDGHELTYLQDDALWTVASDFSGTPTLLPGTEVAGNRGPGSWSSDGTVLLFDSDEGTHAWQRRSASEDPVKTADVIIPASVRSLGSGGGLSTVFPEFSPDGNWFVYVAVSESGPAGWRQPPPGPLVPGLWPSLAEALAEADCASVECCRYALSARLARRARHEYDAGDRH